MKKSILSFAIACLVCGGAFAQNTTTVKPASEGGFILKGGVNLANISRDGGNVYEANRLTSFNVGFAVDMPLGLGISLQPGLVFTGKGSKTQNGQPTDASYF